MKSKKVKFENIDKIIIKYNHPEIIFKNGDRIYLIQSIDCETGIESVELYCQKFGINRLDSAVQDLWSEWIPYLKKWKKSKNKKNREDIAKFMINLWNEQISFFKNGMFNVVNPKVKKAEKDAIKNGTSIDLFQELFNSVEEKIKKIKKKLIKNNYCRR